MHALAVQGTNLSIPGDADIENSCMHTESGVRGRRERKYGLRRREAELIIIFIPPGEGRAAVRQFGRDVFIWLPSDSSDDSNAAAANFKFRSIRSVSGARRVELTFEKCGAQSVCDAIDA